MQADQTVLSLRPGGGGGNRGSRLIAPRFDSVLSSTDLRPHGAAAGAGSLLSRAGDSWFETHERARYTRDMLLQLRQVVAGVPEEILKLKHEIDTEFSSGYQPWGRNEPIVPSQPTNRYDEPDNLNWRQKPLVGDIQEERSKDSSRESRPSDTWQHQGDDERDIEREVDVEMEADVDREVADNAGLEGMDAYCPSKYDSDDSQSAGTHRPEKGRGGRFVGTGSTSGSRKRSRTGADDSWMVKGLVPGGPDGDTVIPSFLGHVASRIWTGEMRGILKCQNRAAVCLRLGDWYNRMPDEAREMIDGTGLSHLHSTMFSHVDHPLICAFIERWQPDTNTFHMPFGEMTIMMHDVWHILRLPVEGQMVTANPDTYDLQTTCMDFMGVSRPDFLSAYWSGGGVSTDKVFNICGDDRIEETQARAWVWIMLGSTLFVDKSGNRIRPSCLHELKDGLESVNSYSWASATLAYLYRHLGVASRGDSQGVAGCLTLLQAWIYEYFPCFRPNRERMIVDADSPRACMWNVRVEDRSDSRLRSFRSRLDQMEASEVMWLPYSSDPVNSVPRTIFAGWLLYRDIMEPYMPVRVLRQLGYVQHIPHAIYRPQKAVRSWASRLYKVDHPYVVAVDSWNMFPDVSILPVSRYQPCVEDPTACDRMYLTWYYRRSHPQLLNDWPPAATVPLSRSNSEYWVNRLANITRDTLKDLRDEDAAAAHAAKLEKCMKDWHLAN